MILFKLAKLLSSIFILTLLISKIDFDQLFSIILSADKPSLFFAMLITFLSMYLRWVKWHFLVSQSTSVKKTQSLYIYLVGLFFSSFTPAKLGDMVRVKYLQQLRVSFSQSFFLSAIDRVFDLSAISTYAILAIFFFPSYKIIGFIAITIILCIILILQARILQFFVLRLMKLIPKNLHQNSLINFFTSNNYSKIMQKILTKPMWIFFFAISLSTWFSLALQTQLLLASFSTSVPIWQLVTIICSGAIVGLIPLSFSGYGFREGTIAILFTQLGVPYETAFSVALLYTFLSFLLPAMISGLIYLFFDPYYEKKYLS